MKEFLNADFKDIIAEIKKSRKGAAMIICFICLCCAAIDYVLRKYGININWFTGAYISIFFTSLATIFIKAYNSICDKIDREKKLKEKQKQTEQKIIQDYYLLRPILNSFKDERIHILKNFVLKKTTKITIIQFPVTYTSNYIDSINKYIYSFGYEIDCTDLNDFIIAEITPEFYEILELYFSEGLK